MLTKQTSPQNAGLPLRIVAKHHPAPPPMRPPIDPPKKPLSFEEQAYLLLIRQLSPAAATALSRFYDLIASPDWPDDQYDQARRIDDFRNALPPDILDELAAFTEQKQRADRAIAGDYEPRPDDLRTFYSDVMSGAVWHNAVRPKLLMAGWHAISTESHFSGRCVHCGSTCIAGMDWIGPDHERDADAFRSFIRCMECDRSTEMVFVRYSDDLPSNRVLYEDNPLIDADARPLRSEQAGD